MGTSSVFTIVDLRFLILYMSREEQAGLLGQRVAFETNIQEPNLCISVLRDDLHGG
jgi:hypothetical protein